MSCLNLKFPPARKAWKIFTTKIRRKLRILQPPKKKSVYQPVRNRVPRRSFLKGRGVQRPRRYMFKRKHRSPVFIDEMFRPALDMKVLEHGLRADPEKCGTSRSIKMMERSTDEEAGTSGAFTEVGEGGDSTTVVGEGGDSTTVAGDNIWESVAMASPLMRRIDERAEEFITKFRAEMVDQEMAAGDL